MVFAGRVKRPSTLAIAAILLLSSLIPIFAAKKAAAYGSPTERMVQMSSSANGATGVTYKIKFKAGTASPIAGIVVDFCSTTPIIGDTCSLPTTFSIGASPTVTPVSANIATGWTAASANTNRTLIFTKTSGTITPAVGDILELDLTGVVNPATTNATFYARILTYPSSATASGYSATAVGSPVDAGGAALSTAAQIIVTAKVQERLLFCVYTTGTGNDCTSKSGSTVTLGDTNGVLDPTGPYVSKNTKYSVTTNASGGAIIRLKGATLTSGSNTIDANLTPAASSAGTEQFGVCVYQSAGSGMLIDTLYDGDLAGATSTACTGTAQSAGTGTTGGGNSADFVFDTNGTDGTGSLYGDTLANKPAGDYSTATIAMLGNISNTTEAGIYTSTLTFIATGTY
jgi:hypothetical protein